MLLTEWNWDDALDVRFEEGREEGGEKRAKKIAKKMKEQGDSPEKIHAATDIPIEDIKKL
jgi:predicted transposase YdaD